jgi:hypothetical protein
MSPTDLTAVAVLAAALADLDPREFFSELKSDEEDEDIARIRDAGRAIISAQARMVRTYFQELRVQGFTDAQALELAAKFKPTLEFAGFKP